MTAPPLDIARRALREECDAAGVYLVTPDSNHVVRSAAEVLASVASPLTLAEVRERVSFYVPVVAADAWETLDRLAAGALPDWPRQGVGLVLLAPAVWSDALRIVGTGAHEIAHRFDDVHAVKSPLGGLRHAAGYVLCECVRGHSEGIPYTQNLAAEHILRDVDLDAWIEGACLTLASTYRLGAHEVSVQRRTLESAAASLRAGCFHGEGTPVARILARCVALGWEPPPAWREAITATKVTP